RPRHRFFLVAGRQVHETVSLARPRPSRRLGQRAAFTFAPSLGRNNQSLTPRGVLLELFDSPGFELPGSSTDGGLGGSSRHAVVGAIRDWSKNRRLGAGCRFDLAHQRAGAVVV